MLKTVQIYEDDAALRVSLEELLTLSGEFVVMGSFDNAKSAAIEVRDASPDIILMDIDLPGMSGIEAVKEIRSFDRRVYIIMLTVFDDSNHILEAICAGASGYLLKKNVSEKLIPAIRDVLAEGATLSPSVAKMILQSMQKQSASKNYDFTLREEQILKLMCKGNSYKMIGTEIGLTFETIRSYVKKIYEKLQVHSATEAVSKAINEKLV